VHPVEAREKAEELFMKIACELEPELMRSFFRNVYQSAVHRDLWRTLGQRHVDLRPLSGVIWEWLTSWNLGQPGKSPRWLLDGAICTILEYDNRCISPFEPMPSDHNLAWGSGIDYYDPDSNPPLEIAYPIQFEEFEWDPLLETKRGASNRIFSAIREQLRRHLAEIENEAGEIFWKAHAKDSSRHYTWLARHLIKKEPISRIAETPGPIARNRGCTPQDDQPVDDRAVTKAIREIAKFLLLPIPHRLDVLDKRQLTAFGAHVKRTFRVSSG